MLDKRVVVITTEMWLAMTVLAVAVGLVGCATRALFAEGMPRIEGVQGFDSGKASRPVLLRYHAVRFAGIAPYP